jgi:hypothetical protein
MAAKFDLVVAAKTVGAASIKRLGNSMQGVQGRVKNLRMAMSGLNKTFATLGLILSAGAFVRMVKGTIDAADAFGKLEIQTGIAANTLQGYVNVGKLAGVEQATIEKGLRRLTQSIHEADQGVATYKDAFDALGITVRNTDGTLKTNEQLINEISNAFSQMEDGVTKTAIAMEIFGKSGANMVNLLNEGAASLQEFNFEVSERFAQNSEYFNDQMTALGIKLQGFTTQMVDHLLPTLNNLAEMFSNITKDGADLTWLFKSINFVIKTLAASLFTVVAGFRFLGTTIVQVAKAAWKAAKFDFKGAYEELQNGLTTTREQFEKDMKIFEKIWNGSSEASEKYGKKTNNMLEKTFGQSMLAKLDTFKKSIKGVGDAMGDVVVKGIKGMEDALVDFVMKGTLSFRKLANSIISDMVRIAIQQTITLPFTTFVEGLFKNADGNAFINGKVQKYAYGGVVNKPTLFPMANGVGLMGEAGAEAILPLRRGSNGKLGVQSTGGGIGNIVVNVDASGSSVEGNEQGGREFGRAIAAAIQSELIKQKRPGGLLA